MLDATVFNKFCWSVGVEALSVVQGRSCLMAAVNLMDSDCVDRCCL